MTQLSIDEYPEGVMIIDPANLQIHNINSRAAELFGIHTDKLPELKLTDLIPEAASVLTDRAGTPLIQRIPNGAETRIVEITVPPVKNDRRSRHPVVLREITGEYEARQNLEKKLERCRLLNTEIHHRVNNSLAIVSSLINLMSEKVDDRGKLSHLTSQIDAVAALHRQLSQHPETAEIDIASYLDTVTRNALHAYGFQQVCPELRVKNCTIPAKTATSLGIIVNEIIINSCKHGFDTETRSTARLRLELESHDGEDGTELILTISNNGKYRRRSPEHSAASGTGKALINALLQELDARLTLKTEPHPVFEIRLTIRDE